MIVQIKMLVNSRGEGIAQKNFLWMMEFFQTDLGSDDMGNSTILIH